MPPLPSLGFWFYVFTFDAPSLVLFSRVLNGGFTHNNLKKKKKMRPQFAFLLRRCADRPSRQILAQPTPRRMTSLAFGGNHHLQNGRSDWTSSPNHKKKNEVVCTWSRGSDGAHGLSHHEFRRRRIQPCRALSTATAMGSLSSSSDAFPSLLIRRDSIQASGSFAETTAMYLDPDPTNVQQLSDLLQKTNTGIVAHYYMDVELQGVLTAVKRGLQNHNHIIGIADSLKMGDMAVEMAQQQGVKQVICLGVDFMAESVQAILHKNGFGHIPVYRADARKIGCSLAESAESKAYQAWLQKEGQRQGQSALLPLHVIYINTSLETKAVGSSMVPTITCTSSNVLQIMLQASSQIGPDLKVLYGPDTYMGHNLQRLLQVVAEQWTDEQIAQQLHPQHNRTTLQHLHQNLSVFPSGNCVVHHMFGASVVDTVQRYYSDCYVTAHLEVPGEMFEVAMVKSLIDEGVVGSTSNILHFIQRKVQEQQQQQAVAAETSTTASDGNRLRFILGTEAGMVTSIVQSVQQILNSSNKNDNNEIEVEIIFPVASEAVTATSPNNSSDTTNLKLVPGVSGGEGCSTAGGCATCPYMKMNHLDAVMDLLTMIENVNDDNTKARLRKHLPPDRLSNRQINGQDATDLGSEAILYMRAFMKQEKLPSELCSKVYAHGDRN